ncbi:hypothetical protein ACF0H5_024496 [Mactra antiquata]
MRSLCFSSEIYYTFLLYIYRYKVYDVNYVIISTLILSDDLSTMQDLEIFKQVPGYKAILKAVLKNQIQSLVQQLSEQTGEESMFVTASLEEGTLSQLGSDYGKTFLDGHDEIKSQFLGFCINKKQVQSKTKEFQSSYHGNQWSKHHTHGINLSTSKRSHPYIISNPHRSKRWSSQNPAPNVESYSKHENEGTSENDLKPAGTNGLVIADNNDKIEYSKDKSAIDNANDLDNDYGNESETTDECNEETDVDGCAEIKLKNDPDGAEELITDVKVEDDDDEVNDDTEYVYTGLDDTKPTSDDVDHETLDATLDLTVNNQNSNDSCENSDCEIKPDNGCYGTQCDIDLDNNGVLMTSSGNLERFEKCERKSKLNTVNFFKTEKSLKERKLELENYLNLENPDRPYPCNLCPKRFKERHHLVYHLRTHSGHRPYVCSICKKGFTQSSSLNTHKKLHLKDMSCDFCGKVFRKISLLNNHLCCT